jgi:hypothetical protein
MRQILDKEFEADQHQRLTVEQVEQIARRVMRESA